MWVNNANWSTQIKTFLQERRKSFDLVAFQTDVHRENAAKEGSKEIRLRIKTKFF